MAINPENIDVIKVNDLPTGAFALANLILQSDASGLMTKNTQSNFAAFIAPYVAAIASSGYVNVTSNSLPTPSGSNSFSIVGSGTYTHSGGSVNATGDLNIIYWNGTLWSLSKAISVDLTGYAKSQDINVTNNGVNVSLSGANYNILIPSGNYVFDARGGYRILAPATYSIPSDSRIVYLSASNSAYVDPGLDVKGTGQILYLWAETYDTKSSYRPNAFSVAATWSGGYVARIPAFIMAAEKYVDYITDANITANGVSLVQDLSGSIIITVPSGNFVFDALGGYRLLSANTYTVPNSNILYLSASASSYVDPNLKVKGTGQTLYLWAESYDTKTTTRTNAFPVGVSWSGKWTARIPGFNVPIVDRFVTYENKGILPTRSKEKSEFSTDISSFISKWSRKEQDVTLVQLGDSISTNLGYTTPLSDAAYRPPFMTENNLNAFLEEKLRWPEQQYRRFDAKLVQGGSDNAFTDILGGGTASVIDTDSAWFASSSTILPLTKVIDGGTSSGVAYTFPAGMKRCNLIIHTDFKNAVNATVTIVAGNGKVEIFNGTTWVEANGYIYTGKESNTLYLGEFYKDQTQVRLNMRSLTDLTAKVIYVINNGTGRFGYWGMEYSPREFMFKYIASSIGGQGIIGLRKREPWMLDAFNPDLVLQQACIINQSAAINPPYSTPQQFADLFDAYYDALHTTKGYLVLPYILFVGAGSGIVNNSTGAIQTAEFGGKTITVQDYALYTADMYKNNNAPFVNLFNRFLELANAKAKSENTNNIYTSALNGSGIDGTTFTVDGTHLNNYGQEIAKRILEPYFNF